jgi:cyclopropane-fatty-acyl-phospholipid synthase
MDAHVHVSSRRAPWAWADRLIERPPVAPVVAELLGRPDTVRVDGWDGSRAGPADAPARVVLRSPAAVHRIVAARGELGFARAYVAGDIDVGGDVFELARVIERVEGRIPTGTMLRLVRVAGAGALRRLPTPAEEARLRGRRHTPARDAAAIAHHYDVSNAFFRIVLGPSLTYSCAVFATDGEPVDVAQARKHELVCRKLGLRPGMRVLDVGCGWGSFLLHAARRHGVTGVGVTLSSKQAELATRRVAEAGLADRISVRQQDYRDVRDGPFDAIASVGMFEHVGVVELQAYFRRLFWLLRPGGRLLNHGISRGHRYGIDRDARFTAAGFIDRYVFPDGELHEIGTVVTTLQRAGFEACHVEGLRDHYARTLRAWVANLERAWSAAVGHAGAARARVWRLYMAASAIAFETNRTSLHQVLAVHPASLGTGMPLRPQWEPQEVDVRASQ